MLYPPLLHAVNWFELAFATIESIAVLGALHASKAVKAALSDRIG